MRCDLLGEEEAERGWDLQVAGAARLGGPPVTSCEVSLARRSQNDRAGRVTDSSARPSI